MEGVLSCKKKGYIVNRVMHVSYSVKELLSNWLGTTMTQNPDITRSIWENRAIIFIDQIKCAHYVYMSWMNVPTERSNKQKGCLAFLPARPDPILTATFLLCTQTFDDGRDMHAPVAGRACHTMDAPQHARPTHNDTKNDLQLTPSVPQWLFI